MRKLKKMPRFITFAFLTKRLFACEGGAREILAEAGTEKVPLDALAIYQIAGGEDNSWRIRWLAAHLCSLSYLSHWQYARVRRCFYDENNDYRVIDADAAREIAAVLTAPRKTQKKTKARTRTRR